MKQDPREVLKALEEAHIKFTMGFGYSHFVQVRAERDALAARVSELETEIEVLKQIIERGRGER